MKKLRLLVTTYCPRNCEGCCNQDWDSDKLPVARDFDYDEILITGGEPLCDIEIFSTIEVIEAIQTLFPNPKRKIYIYTSIPYACTILGYCDGVTLTLHTQEDANVFVSWYKAWNLESGRKSMRLNVFKGVTLPKEIDVSNWKVRWDMEWIKDCPLPEDEVFMKLKGV